MDPEDYLIEVLKRLPPEPRQIAAERKAREAPPSRPSRLTTPAPEG